MLTDDADSASYTGCEPFGPSDDYDPMYEGYGDAPKCGGSRVNEWNEREGCQGCRHCDPPDHENKPYGWGIERCEDPALEAANKATHAKYSYDTRGMYTSAWTVLEPWHGSNVRVLWYGNFTEERREFRDFLWRVWSKWDAKLSKCSDRIWDRLCDTCETHAEAKAKYTAWAEKRTGKKAK